MKRRFTAFSWVVITAFFAVSCENEKLMPGGNDSGSSFFPVKVGDYRIYQVEEITFSLVNENDTSEYQLRELVSGFYLNQQGDTSFVLSRFKRKEDKDPWKVDSVRAIRNISGQVIVTSGNIPVVKLAYPVKEGLMWDSNAFNTLQADEYEIKNVNASFETQIANFENTLTVIENNNPDSVIFQDYRMAVYAKGIGLIYREEKILHYCATSVECLGKEIIESGLKYKQQLTGFGNE